jgi:hypothetical protein
MAMKHRDIEKKHKHLDRTWNRLRGRRDDPDTTKQYTPQDVHALLRQKGNGSGIIRPDTNDLHIPSGIEAIGEGEQADGPPRIMLVIVTLALIFISIITYFVSNMPPKD